MEGQGYSLDGLTIDTKTVTDDNGVSRTINVWKNSQGDEISDIGKYLRDEKEKLWDSEQFQ